MSENSMCLKKSSIFVEKWRNVTSLSTIENCQKKDSWNY